jgi:hypothetical protein
VLPTNANFIPHNSDDSESKVEAEGSEAESMDEDELTSLNKSAKSTKATILDKVC